MTQLIRFQETFPRDARAILSLAGPLAVNNLVLAGMMLTNTAMAGRLGPGPLAGVAVGNSYYQAFWLFGLGVLMSISPLVAHSYGGGRDFEVGRRFRQGVWLALMLAVPLVSLLACVEPALRAFGTDARAIPHAAGYVHAMCFGMPAMLVFLAHRYTSEGIGWTRPVMYTALVGLAVNVAGNLLFTRGSFGIASRGAQGCGIATALACWSMLVTMHLYQRRHERYRRFGLFARFEHPDRGSLREILALGLPIAGSVVSEGALFVVAALLMSTLGTVQVAAHQVAIAYASLMFMLPLSLHSATTIHVGHQLGRGDPAAARNAGWAGIAMCGLVMAASSLVLLAAREGIAAAFTTDPQVLALATSLLLFVAAFQVPDGLQVGAAGALRGFRDAQVPMALNFTAYWLVGFPLAWWFGIHTRAGPGGIWSGLIAGLFTCAALLIWRYRRVSRGPADAVQGGGL
jgi:MATE family multidrug resistance protein